MPTLLCGCGRFMQVKKNSVTVEQLFADGLPYRLFDADLWECVECGVEIIAGFGAGPIAEHWQPDYAEQRARLAPIYPGRCRADQGVHTGIDPVSLTCPTCGAFPYTALDVRATTGGKATTETK